MQFGALAERYFRDDPSTCLYKIRQFAELLAKLIAARHGLYEGERDTFDETLRRLRLDRVLPREVADVFHRVRILGNAAVHEAAGGHVEALNALKFARQLGVWFYRTYAKEPAFKPGPFTPPVEPVDATAALKAEIEVLRRKVEESESAAARAQREAGEEARARESIEQRLKREVEERAVWEQLAQESQAEKNEIAARLSAVRAAAERAPRIEAVQYLQAGVEAAAQIDLDEGATRERIDQQLRDRGWQADTKKLRFSEGTRPTKGQNMAIAEWPTASGPADYALFVGLELVGMVEATLSPDGEGLPKADIVLTNPPFGTKKGGGRPTRSDFSVTAGTSNKQLAFVEHVVRALKPGGRCAMVVPDNVLFEDNTGRSVRSWLMELCNLHTILRLPTGIFYAQGVKTNVLFFQRGKTDKANTKAVWVYDMRANMPAFGKTRPLQVADFKEFEAVYGKDVNGGSKCKDEGEEGRWRCFTREQITARNDNLDIAWLRGTETEAEEQLTEPEDIAAAIIGHLKAALEDIETLSEELEQTTALFAEAAE